MSNLKSDLVPVRCARVFPAALVTCAGSGPPTTASGPPPCEAFDAAFANGCVDCTCESGARGITDSLLPRSDRDSGGSGDGKRDNTQYTISAQVPHPPSK